MLIRIACFMLIAIGFALLTTSALHYSILTRKVLSATRRQMSLIIFISITSIILIWIFAIGYALGAIDILLVDELQPFHYLVSIIFFLGAIFVFLMVQNQRYNTRAFLQQNNEKQFALEEATANNLELNKQVAIKLVEVKHQDRLLHTLNDVASILLASNVETFENDLWRCMGILAECANADRVYVWKNHEIDGRLYCTQVYEWSEKAEPQQGNELTVNMSYDDIMPGWENTLFLKNSINSLVRNMGEKEREQLEPQGIISILVVPVFLQEHFWGFVGFDDCHRERIFTDTEDNTLRSASLLIAHALLRNEMTQNLMKAREDALSSTRAKGQFLANMSHEIRTPINAITGMATIARNTDDLTKVHQCLDKVDAASRQLLGIINDILDMSKIDANKMELTIEPFNLYATIENVKNIIEMKATEKQQNLSINIDENVPQIVIGDDMRLAQILLNLLSNAVKFTPNKGDIFLSLYSEKTQNNVHCLKAEVRDNGIGIASEQLERLFRSFEQADKGTSKRYGGSGLGLAISKRIAELMGGDITVESQPKKGSCFTLTFHLHAGTANMMNNSKKEINYDFNGCNALLVEDIPVNQEIVKALLENYGVYIECVDNGQEAVELFLQKPLQYDIIFMDLHMPVMDGYEATKSIRGSVAPDAVTIPILAMTANAFAEDVIRCRAAGMNDHIAKPIDIDLLLQKMSKLIPKYNTHTV